MKTKHLTLLSLAIAILVITFGLPGCSEGPQDSLRVETLNIGFIRAIKITNIGETPIDIEKVLINNKYPVTQTLVMANGVPWKTTTIEMGEYIAPLVPNDCPEPIVVEVETNKGTAKYGFQ